MQKIIGTMLKPIHRRVMLMISRGVVKLVDDSLKMQGMQITLLANETKDNIEHFQPYGLTAVPLAGAECIALSLGGSRDHTVVIMADDRRYRLKNLANGEVALYSHNGDSIILREGNTIEVNTLHLVVNATASVTMTAPAINFNTAALHVTGDILDNSMVNTKTIAAMRGIFNSHTHIGHAAGSATDTTTTPM